MIDWPEDTKWKWYATNEDGHSAFFETRPTKCDYYDDAYTEGCWDSEELDYPASGHTNMEDIDWEQTLTARSLDLILEDHPEATTYLVLTDKCRPSGLPRHWYFRHPKGRAGLKTLPVQILIAPLGLDPIPLKLSKESMKTFSDSQIIWYQP